MSTRAAARDEACPANRLSARTPSLWTVAAWLALAMVLVAMVPLFLCMPPWIDTALFDMCAREVLRGELPYRDFYLHAAPGIVLAYSLVRSIFGWSSIGLRSADLLIITLIGILCVWKFLPARASISRRVLLLAVIYLFYFSVGEWSHCQQDPWMLLPALVALALHLQIMTSGRALPGIAFLQGVAWGMAFLVKPFVAVPALCAVCLDSRLYQRRWRSAVLTECAGVLLGGLVVGAATVGWLFWTGNWPYFYQETFGSWNQDYFLGAEGPGYRTEHLLTWFWPWTLLHLLAVPIAVWTIARSYSSALSSPEGSRSTPLSSQKLAPQTPLFSASGGRGQGEGVSLRGENGASAPSPVDSAPAFAGFYLGWLFQATYLQHQLCYQMVPAVILALTILAGAELTILGESHRTLRWLTGLAACGFIAWCLLCHPLLLSSRIRVWPRCWSEGSSAKIRNALTCETDLSAPDWVRLGEVEAYLRGRRLRDHELTCYAPSTIHVYRDLDTKPSTRFVLLMPAMSMFAGHRAEIADEVRRSPERYILSDLLLLGIGYDQADRGTSTNLSDLPPTGPNAPPDFAQRYPYIFPAPFRAGRYFVHERKRL